MSEELINYNWLSAISLKSIKPKKSNTQVQIKITRKHCMTSRILSVIIFYLLYLPFLMADSTDFKCVVISGKLAESESASSSALNDNDLMLRKGSKIGNNKCKIFGSWKKAYEFITNLKMDQRAQVLIYQGAHGSPGGSSALNEGPESAEKFLNI